MSDTQTGGPAFPSTEPSQEHTPFFAHHEGMTLRQYAAIKLRAPDSGTDWLDDMIRASIRDEFAAKAMQALISAPHDNEDHTLNMEFRLSEGLSYSGATRGRIAVSAYAMADAMLNDHEQQVIQRLAEQSGVMPRVCIDGTCLPNEVCEALAKMQARVEQETAAKLDWFAKAERYCEETNDMRERAEQAEARVEQLEAFVSDVAKQKPEKPDYWSVCGQCERNISAAEDLIDAALKGQQ